MFCVRRWVHSANFASWWLLRPVKESLSVSELVIHKVVRDGHSTCLTNNVLCFQISDSYPRTTPLRLTNRNVSLNLHSVYLLNGLRDHHRILPNLNRLRMGEVHVSLQPSSQAILAYHLNERVGNMVERVDDRHVTGFRSRLSTNQLADRVCDHCLVTVRIRSTETVRVSAIANKNVRIGLFPVEDCCHMETITRLSRAYKPFQMFPLATQCRVTLHVRSFRLMVHGKAVHRMYALVSDFYLHVGSHLNNGI